MAGKRDHAVVAVVDGLTNAEAAQMTKEIMKAKGKYAAKGRGTIASGKKSDVAALLQAGHDKILAIGTEK